jgi:hypothetical protein
MTSRVRSDGHSELDKHAVVTFTLEGVTDLQLDGFSTQNVIFGLLLRRAADQPNRRSYLGFDPLPQDVEIELQPCYGLHGWIRARTVAITFSPGKPDKQDA